MNHDIIIQKLASNSEVFKSLFSSIPDEQVNWKPTPEKWCLLEIVNHLLDEEIYDFRQRIEFALLKPYKEWTRIAPVKWVMDKDYINKNFGESLKAFLTERQDSVKWLKDFSSPDWNAVDNYPFGKVMTAGDALVNWLAHDYLHIRQINKLNRNYLESIAPSVDLSYAGDW